MNEGKVGGKCEAISGGEFCFIGAKEWPKLWLVRLIGSKHGCKKNINDNNDNKVKNIRMKDENEHTEKHGRAESRGGSGLGEFSFSAANGGA